MVLIYSRDASLAQRIAGLVSAESVVVTAWPEVRAQTARAHVCILASSSLDGVGVAERLAELRRWTVHAPVVMVVPMTEENATTLATVTVESVLWTHRLEDRAYVLDGLNGVRKSLQARLAAAALAMERTPDADRELIARLCEMDPPPASAADAAKLLATSESTLRRKVSGAFVGVPNHGTEHLLEWLRLLWCCDPIRQGQKPTMLGRLLGRSRRTLLRTAKQLTGTTLGDLRRDPEKMLRLLLSAYQLPRDSQHSRVIRRHGTASR